MIGQKFVPGYYINVNSDTIRGEILQADLKSIFDQFVFKKAEIVETIDHKKAITFSYLDGRKFTASIVKDKYLEVLAEGKLSIYQRGDLYYFTKNDRIFLIDATPIKVEDNNSLIFVIDPQWKTIIKTLTSDCETEFLSQITEMVPNTKNFITAVEEYNRCYESSSKLYAKDNEWTRIKYGATVGYRHSSLRFNNFNRRDKFLNEVNFSHDTYLGISFNIHSPRLSRRFAFQADFLYHKQRFYSSNIEADVDEFYDNQVLIDVSRFEFPTHFTYRLNKGFLSTFLDIGISTDYLNHNVIYFTDFKEQDKVTTQLIDEPFKIKSWQNSIIAGTSIVFDFQVVELSADFKIRIGDRFNKTGYFNAYDRDILYGITLYFKTYD